MMWASYDPIELCPSEPIEHSVKNADFWVNNRPKLVLVGFEFLAQNRHFFGPNRANLGPNMPDNCAADQLIGSVKLGERAVSCKTPIYFMTIYLQLAVTDCRSPTSASPPTQCITERKWEMFCCCKRP